MPSFRSIEPARAPHERGDALVESMVGVLLMGIVGLGATYAASRIAVAQREQAVQSTAIAQMREVLRTTNSADLCAGTAVPTIAIGGTDYTLSVSCPAVGTVTVGGTAVAAPPPSVTLTLSSPGLLSGSGVVVVKDGA